MAEHLIIAIDGPSGAGKTTLGRMLARELGLFYIDTGSMYRAVAVAVLETSTKETDDVTVGTLAESIDIDLAGDPDSLRVTLDGRDVTDRIRDEDVTDMSSSRMRSVTSRPSSVTRNESGSPARSISMLSASVPTVTSSVSFVLVSSTATATARYIEPVSM